MSTALLFHHTPVRMAVEKTMPTDALTSLGGTQALTEVLISKEHWGKRQFSSVSTPRELVIFLLKFIPIEYLRGKIC